METETSRQDDSLTSAVLQRIETEQVSPHSRLFFVAREAGVWSLWLLTVIIGALALAVTVTVGAYRYATGYELTHDSFLGYAAEVLPYLWIVVFSAMAFLAVYNLRHTKRGYRYSLVTIVGSSLIFSAGGGILLHMFGLGFSLDHLLGAYVPSYISQDKMEQKIWQRPEEGRLLGMFVDEEGFDGNIHFIDVKNGVWTLVVRELPPPDKALVLSGEQVRLFGQLLSVAPPVFHVCGVLPWLKERMEERNEMAHMREEFKERMSLYHFKQPSDDPSRVCAQVRGLQRIRFGDNEEVESAFSY